MISSHQLSSCNRFHHRASRRARAAVLLELLISVVLLVSASAVIIGTIQTTVDRLARERDEQIAIDLATSIMAQIEAGIVRIESIHDTRMDLKPSSLGTSGRGGFGEPESAEEFDERAIDEGRWRVEIDRERSRFPGLSLVTVRVFDEGGTDGVAPGGGNSFGERNAAYVLHQLVRVQSAAGGDDAREFAEDELMRGIDRGSPGGGP